MKPLVAMFLALLCLVLGSSAGESDIQRFDGSKVIRVQATTMQQYELLVNLAQNERYLDFWTDPALNDFTDIMVSASHYEELETYLKTNEIEFKIQIHDVQKLIDEQKAQTGTSFDARAMNWTAYQTLDTIFNWLEELSIQYPSLASIINFGNSTEGRPMKAIKISTGGANKIGFWIDATIHAREWIATATATYIINELVTKSDQYQDILSVLDFYIVPVVNPDGYSYTHTTNRMWRKTRSNHGSPFGCRGVDANRNFGFGFGGPGSSNDKCDETYRGPYAFSEPEAEAVKNFINSLNATVDWQTSITLHSYSQLFMTPWGYTTDVPDDYTELMRVADLAVATLTSMYGTSYTTGSSANVLYHSSGSSRDWAKGEGGFKYVYTIELRDKGVYGFLLPAAQIIPTAQETWAALQVVARNHLQGN